MPINATDAPVSGGKRPPILDEGPYPTRLVQVVDLGLQPQSYLGEEKPPAREILTTYEFVDEFLLDDDGEDIKDKPRWLSESFVLYNLASEKAKSTKRYNALDPNHIHKGDFSQLINTPAIVILGHNPNKKDPSRPWENIMSVSPMRSKDVPGCPELVNKPVVFDLEEPDLEVFLSLPQWIQKKVMSNLEFNGSALQEMLEGEAPANSSEPTDNYVGTLGEDDEKPW